MGKCIVSQFIIPVSHDDFNKIISLAQLPEKCQKQCLNSFHCERSSRKSDEDFERDILAQQKGIPLHEGKTTRVSEQY